MFRISRARVNIAKKQFSNLANEYEITFENNTEVEPVNEVRLSFYSLFVAHEGEEERGELTLPLHVARRPRRRTCRRSSSTLRSSPS